MVKCMYNDTHVYTLILYLPNGGEHYTEHNSVLRIHTPLTREALIEIVAEHRKGYTGWTYKILRDAIVLDAKEQMRVFYDADDYNRFENI